MTRRHNDANMLAFGQSATPVEEAKEIFDVFMKTEFEGGRHQRRVDKISQHE
jgi:Ribose 5-phosphate isomerase RpiB